MPTLASPKKNKKRNLLAPVVAVALVGVIIVIVLAGGSGVSPFPSYSTEIGGAVGQTAPDVSLQTIDGETIKLSDFRDKPVVVWFMAAWCPTCVGQASDLQKIQDNFGSEFVIIAIDLWTSSNIGSASDPRGSDEPAETAENLRAFKNLYGGDWIWTLDTDRAALKYRITIVDSTVIVDSTGKIVYRKDGPTGYDNLANALRVVL